MRDVFRGFYSLPDLERGESLSSWVCRAAASQMMTCAEFCNYLGVPKLSDLDKAMLDWLWRVSPYIDEQRWGGMLLAGRVLEAMIALGPWCMHPLLSSDEGAAQYGFCPLCLAGQSTHYLPIEWRLRLWRVCPTHHCGIQRRCHSCDAKLEIPFDFSHNNRRAVEIPSLGHCLRCACPLSSAPEYILPRAQEDVYTGLSEDRHLADTEVAAALYHGIAVDAPSAIGSRAQRILGVAYCGRLLMKGRATSDRVRLRT